MYAQLSLPSHPNQNIKNLKIGLRTAILDHVGSGASVESLAQAIAHDTRALRHGLLIADLGRDADFRVSQSGQRLLDRVLTIFFQSFTPTAIDHPFNDDVFTSGMVRVLKALIEGGKLRVRDRLESFGLELSDHVDRWTGDSVPAPIRNKLLARFAIVYARTVIAAARALHSDPDTADLGRTLYRSLVRVYLEHYKTLEGDSSFGAIEFALRPLYPEMLGRPLEQIEIGDVIDASHAMARIESEFGAFEDDDDIERDDPRKAVGVSALLLRKPERDAPLTASVEVLERRQTVGRLVLRAYLGIELLSDLKDWLL
jgi:hypothetical protein